MPQYVIEREIAGAGDLTGEDLKGRHISKIMRYPKRYGYWD